MIVTIDGPAGAGKSTVARRVAKTLGLRYLDTGAMYRAYTWMAMERGIDLDDARAILRMMRREPMKADAKAIRAERVTRHVYKLANVPVIRREMMRRQRAIGCRGGLVTEGRDQGSVVFPRADLKIYLTASVEERARRRHAEVGGSLEEIRREIARRDRRDRRRKVGALKVPRGAWRIDTTGRSIREVVDVIVRLA